MLTEFFDFAPMLATIGSLLNGTTLLEAFEVDGIISEVLTCVDLVDTINGCVAIAGVDNVVVVDVVFEVVVVVVVDDGVFKLGRLLRVSSF